MSAREPKGLDQRQVEKGRCLLDGCVQAISRNDPAAFSHMGIRKQLTTVGNDKRRARTGKRRSLHTKGQRGRIRSGSSHPALTPQSPCTTLGARRQVVRPHVHRGLPDSDLTGLQSPHVLPCTTHCGCPEHCRPCSGRFAKPRGGDQGDTAETDTMTRLPSRRMERSIAVALVAWSGFSMRLTSLSAMPSLRARPRCDRPVPRKAS